MWRVVFDTNVLVSGLRSTQGAAFALLNAIPSARFQPVLSVSLFNEYLDVLHRPGLLPTTLSRVDVDDFCEDFAAASLLQEVHYRWPGYLPDPKDEMIFDLAVAAGATFLVTHNKRHFPATVMASFGLRAVAPGEFLRLVRSPIP